MLYLRSPVLTHTKNAIAKITRQPTAMANSFNPSERNARSRCDRPRDGVGAFTKRECAHYRGLDRRRKQLSLFENWPTWSVRVIGLFANLLSLVLSRII